MHGGFAGVASVVYVKATQSTQKATCLVCRACPAQAFMVIYVQYTQGTHRTTFVAQVVLPKMLVPFFQNTRDARTHTHLREVVGEEEHVPPDHFLIAP